MSAEFVANMEDVLDLYAEPYDPQRPVVCFDETSTQLLAETRPSLPPRDFPCGRTTNTGGKAPAICLACEPLAGWRQVAVTQRRTMQDFAHQMRWLVDEAYPRSRWCGWSWTISTPTARRLYETFPAADARRIAKRLEFHYTPKHGSWLNTEIELGGCAREGSPGTGAGAQRRPVAVQNPGRSIQTSPPLSFRFLTTRMTGCRFGKRRPRGRRGGPAPGAVR